MAWRSGRLLGRSRDLAVLQVLTTSLQALAELSCEDWPANAYQRFALLAPAIAAAEAPERRHDDATVAHIGLTWCHDDVILAPWN
jgi:hypothetical protein